MRELSLQEVVMFQVRKVSRFHNVRRRCYLNMSAFDL